MWNGILAARQKMVLPTTMMLSVRRIGRPIITTSQSRSVGAGSSAASSCTIQQPPPHHYRNNNCINVNDTTTLQQQRPYSTTRPTSLSATSSSPSIAQLVKQLRESTGAPMMECKKALSSPEVNNDLTLATEWLRKHGTAKASSKVAGREALEGLVGIEISNDGQVASLVKVSSETDFASRSSIFSTFVQDVARAAEAASSSNSVTTTINDIPKFLSDTKSTCNKTNEVKSLAELQNDAILAIRENLSVDSILVLKTTSPQSILGGYVHGKASSDVSCGSAASIVELQVIDETKAKDNVGDVAKKLAMHVVAAKPLYLNPNSVPDDVVNKEKEILIEKMESTGQAKNKPPEIVDKIITGQLRKFYESTCLTEQAHMVEEGNPKVGKVLKSMGLEVKDFKLMGLKE